MTKIPILLSILGVVGRVSGSLNMDLNNRHSSVSPMPIVASGDVSVQGAAPEVIANQNVAGLNFTELSISMGQLKWEFQYEDDQERTFSRYVMASLDFWNGVTEAQADTALATLGEKSDLATWTNWRTEYTARDGRFTKGTTLSAPIAWGDPLNSNQSDIIYYAIEYKNWNDSTVEPVWYRGKLDYRDCAHAPATEIDMTCRFSLDPITNLYNVTPTGGTLSYDDEMAQIARESYLDAIRRRVEELERRKENNDESYYAEIEGTEYAFDTAKRNIETMHASDRLADEINELEQRLTALKQIDNTTPDPDTDQDLDTDSGNTIPGPDEVMPDTGDVNSHPDETTSGETGPNTGSMFETGGTTSDINNKGVNPGHQNTSRDGANNVHNDLVANDEHTNSNTFQEVDDRSGIDLNAGPDIEVPNLGDEIPWLRRHLWVLSLPIVTIALVVFILAKRRDASDDEI